MAPPVAVFTHPDCRRHDPGPGAPERPLRLTTLLDRLGDDPRFRLHEAYAARPDDLTPPHLPGYIAGLRRLCDLGGGRLDPDTIAMPASFDAVLGAAGAGLAALQHAHQGRGHAFAAVRPPGHHALAEQAMGFCLVNTVVVLARHAARLGRERVLIVDWDVHHGNGTQALVETDPTVRYVSLHQSPWYPGTGAANERGVGNIFNVPLGPGLAPERYREALWEAVVAATNRWDPELLLISSGFDAMQGDPLGGFTLEPEHYAQWTARLRERLPATPIVSLLEGGYDPPRLAEGAAAHIAALG